MQHKPFMLDIVTDSFEFSKKFSTVSCRFKLLCLLTIFKTLEQLYGNAMRNKFKLLRIHWGIYNNFTCERIHSHIWKLLQIHKKLQIHINPQQLRSRSKSRNFSVFNRSRLLFECHMYEKLIILKFLLFLFKEKRMSAIPRKLETEGNTLCNIKH